MKNIVKYKNMDLTLSLMFIIHHYYVILYYIQYTFTVNLFFF